MWLLFICNSFEGWDNSFRHLQSCGANQQLKINGWHSISIETSGIAQHPRMCLSATSRNTFHVQALLLPALFFYFIRLFQHCMMAQESTDFQDAMGIRFDYSVVQNRDHYAIMCDNDDIFLIYAFMLRVIMNINTWLFSSFELSCYNFNLELV